MLSFLQRLFGAGRRDSQTTSGTAGSADAAVDPNAPFIASLHDDRVVVHLPNGKREEVEWDKLETVVVRHMNEGSWADESWLILVGTKKSRQGCVVPAHAENFAALLERVRALPGFDTEACERTLATPGPDTVCWERGKSSAAQARGN
ncbi:hypothetical protein MW7_015375 [Imbroritus primus]|uniref:Uncharacterized protein n=1 Tax=Imbroritus primus TaxID=3058603 RepID=A0ACD3SJU4_9BURK|nr:hypothetical protein MW7_015375 [Burkholderiaceae bacterium PBA]